MADATFERPVRGTLHVHLENGETWEATSADLERFNLVKRHDAYMTFDYALGRILRDAGLLDADDDITDAALNPVRYFVETAIAHPDLLDHSDHDGWKSVADLERVLQERQRANETPEES